MNMASTLKLLSVGFTGSRQGLTIRQFQSLRLMLLALREAGSVEFHHGDCLGADQKAHYLAKTLGFRVVLHPPSNPRARAWCVADEFRDPLPYLDRNQAIVDECRVLVAAPRQKKETLRSGTWSTVRRARSAGIPVWFVWPDGTTKKETR